ncbi:MAG: tyrosine-type recombinase/integrase [Candidatus Poseidoniia archaeon]|jgi:integrase/recombinase XerD|nr:tyrosine-type recombinase/integrase [Candidatus Poseidoniia archaeon]
MSDIPHVKLLDAYMADAQLQGLTAGTLKDYHCSIRIFLRFTKKPPVDVTLHDLRDFLGYLKKERDVHPKTVSRYFSAISSFYDFLLFEGRVPTNIVPPFRKRYINPMIRKLSGSEARRQLISVKQARMLVHSIFHPRDRALNVLLAKTGIRRAELMSIDLEDIDWDRQIIRLKPKPKRTNLLVFFDDEVARMLQRWLTARRSWTKTGEDSAKALFLNQQGGRISRGGIYNAVVKYSTRVGLHDPTSKDPAKRFTTHCYRHFVTTHLLRNGMPREYVKELRGDSRHEAVDIYHHIDPRDLREAYLAAVPQLGL